MFDQYDNCNWFNTPTLYGKAILIDDICRGKNRFTLSEDVPVTDKFRDDFNQWAREFFGHDENAVYVCGERIIMCREDYQKIKDKVKPSRETQLVNMGIFREY